MNEIKCALGFGIVRGYADGTVRPINAVTEAESLKIILVASNAGRALKSALPFIQGTENPWWLPYYDFLGRNGLSFPLANGSNMITRGQLAQLIYLLGQKGIIDSNVIKSNLSGGGVVPQNNFNNSVVLPPRG
jgi:hypothetical protein